MLRTGSTSRRGALWAGGLALVALAAFLLLGALGSSGKDKDSEQATPGFAAIFLRAPHVLSSIATYRLANTPALPRYPNTAGSSLEHPIALYRIYAVRQLGLMRAPISELEAALAANDRAAAEDAWRAAYSRYLHLGAVYLTGQVATLNSAIDGTAGGLEGGASNPRFTGLHEIEHGLWTGAEPRSLLPSAQRLQTDVGKLRALLPHVTIEPLEYATRAHEILEDAQRDLLSGAAVPWSQEGVLGTQAGLSATEEVVATLRGQMRKEESLVPSVDTELAALRSELAAIAAAHGGRLPANNRLTQSQSVRLAGVLGGALEALSQIPVTLETEQESTARIPGKDARIDP